MPQQPQLTEEQRKQLEEKIKNMSPQELAEFQKLQCIFCQIVVGKIPSHKVYEDEKTISLLDINPARKGHLLILPKEHYAIMPQLPEKEIGHLFLVGKKLSQVLLSALKVSGTTLFVANGLAAGQRSQHFMLHLIPRKERDEVLEIEEKIIDKTQQQKILEAVENRVSELLGTKKKIVHKKEETFPSSEKTQNSPALNEKENRKEAAEKEEEKDEKKVELDDIPSNIMALVKKKVKGIEIKEIEVEEKNGSKIYEFEGIAHGKDYEVEVEVDSKGKVKKVRIEKDAADGPIEENNPDREEEKKDEKVSLDDIANLFK